MSAPFIDTISCIVTERANSSCEISIQYPAVGEEVAAIQPLATVNVGMPGATSGNFIITSVSKPINGIITATGEHYFYAYNSNTICRGYRGIKSPVGESSKIEMSPSEGKTLSKLIDYINGEMSVSPSRGAVSTDISSSAEEDGTIVWSYNSPTSLRQIMVDAADIYGGIWILGGGTASLSNRRGIDTSLSVSFGINAMSQTVNIDYSNQYTHVIPVWTGDRYIETTEEPGSPDEEPATIGKMETVSVYTNKGYVSTGATGPFKPYIYDVSNKFEKEPTETQLEFAATDFISNNRQMLSGNPVGAEDVLFVDLSKTAEGGAGENIDIGGTVNINTRYGDSISGTCVGYSYDCVKDRFTSIEVAAAATGETSKRSSRRLTGYSIAEMRGKIAELEYAVNHPKVESPYTVTKVSDNEVRADYGGYIEVWTADGENDERHNIKKTVILKS